MTSVSNTLFGYEIKSDASFISLDNIKSFPEKTAKKDNYQWIDVHGDVGHLKSTLSLSGLEPIVIDALTAGETRPRCTPFDDGAIIILRGVNLNEGADPEDMISLRVWVEKSRIISCGLRSLKALDDVVEMVASKRAPKSPSDMVSTFSVRLADRTEPIIAELNERIDEVENSISAGDASNTRASLAEIRRVAIVLRRYMFPQRDALTTLEVEGFSWFSATAQNHLREAIERVTRLCEELDAIRDRAEVVHDRVMDQRAETMNNQMLVLTIVAAFFLPISFLTGLLGMNVGGLPLMESPYGFAIICGAAIGIVAIEYFIFKFLKLL